MRHLFPLDPLRETLLQRGELGGGHLAQGLAGFRFFARFEKDPGEIGVAEVLVRRNADVLLPGLGGDIPIRLGEAEEGLRVGFRIFRILGASRLAVA